MTPKEKAQDLLDKFKEHTNWDDYDDKGDYIDHQKLAAILAVDEIIDTLRECDVQPYTIRWYESVKTEIQTL